MAAGRAADAGSTDDVVDGAGLVTVFTAREVVTMDRVRPKARAVAVAGGRIVSVGDVDEVLEGVSGEDGSGGGREVVVDRTFEDLVLLPGFVEAHGHPLLGGTALTRPLLTYLPVPNPYGPPFPGVGSKAEALELLATYVTVATDAAADASAGAPVETLLAWGYDVVAMGGHLDRDQLDAVSPSHPILVWDASEHFAYANTAALSRYGVRAEDTAINGVMAGPDGQPNGQFLGTTAAGWILREPIQALSEASASISHVGYLMDLSRRHGVTTTSELMFGGISLDLEQDVYGRYFNDPDNRMRCVAVADVATLMAAYNGDVTAAIGYVHGLAESSTDRLMFRGVKFFADDAFLSLGMVVEDPGYTDGHHGIYITDPADMVPDWQPWWQAGMHLHVHTNGNGGNNATITALEQLMRKHPRTGHRFTLEHYGISTPEMTARLAAAGAVVSVNPCYLHHRAELNAPHLGAERAYTAARLRTLVDAGVVTSMHSDTPVGPPIPLEWVWAAVNRFGLSGEVRGPQERVTVAQALRMVTIDAAYTLGVEDQLGSITAGKHADFAVLEEDPSDVDPQAIRDITVWGTVHAGRTRPNQPSSPAGGAT